MVSAQPAVQNMGVPAPLRRLRVAMVSSPAGLAMKSGAATGTGVGAAIGAAVGNNVGKTMPSVAGESPGSA